MNNIINFVLFQILWLSCVIGAANQIIWPALIIILAMFCLYLTPRFNLKKDMVFLLFCLVMGFIVDSLLAYFDLVEYSYNLGLANVAPFWIMILWAGFALTLNHSMAWLLSQPKLGAALIGIGSPLSYFSASKLGAISIHNMIQTLVIISILWLLVFGIILWVNKQKWQQEAINVYS